MNAALDLRRLLVTGISLLAYCPEGQPKCPPLQLYCPITNKCESFLITSCRDHCDSLEASCDSGTKCYTYTDRCNGVWDCKDGIDEHDCFTCYVDEKECDNGKTCYSYLNECDGYYTCEDGKDERNCAELCPTYFCRNNPNQCFTAHDVCDEKRDCSDGTDEEGCPKVKDEAEPISQRTKLIIGIVTAIVGVLILICIVHVCGRRAVMGNHTQTTNLPGAAAYHLASNYPQSENFQVSHNYTYPEQNGTNSNSCSPNDVVVGQYRESNSNSSPAAFQSEHHYSRRGSAEQPLNTSYPGYYPIDGPTQPDIEPSAPEITPPGSAVGCMGSNAASNGPNCDNTATSATACPYPVFVPSSPYPAGETQQSPVAAPPPAYTSLFPDNKSVTQNQPQ